MSQTDTHTHTEVTNQGAAIRSVSVRVRLLMSVSVTAFSRTGSGEVAGEGGYLECCQRSMGMDTGLQVL